MTEARTGHPHERTDDKAQKKALGVRNMHRIERFSHSLMKQEGTERFRKERVLCSRIGRQQSMHTGKASITNKGGMGGKLTLVNVPIVMKVSFFFFEPSLGP
jgi:hypothetical protein